MRKKNYLSFRLFTEIGVIIHFTNLTSSLLASKILVLTNKNRNFFHKVNGLLVIARKVSVKEH